MIKSAALLINTIAVLIYNLFIADVVTITQNAPATAKAESEFTIELTVNKGDATGFAKLQQDLPEGFTATEDKSSSASFTFSNKSVKFIWMNLPSDKIMKISYKVKVAAGMSGDQIIAGKFSYISDNVKQVVDIAPATIKIIPAATQQPIAKTETKAPEPIAETKTQEKKPEPTTPSTPGSINCTRQAPGTATTDFTVEVTISKGNISGFAKYIETLPAGFTAKEIASAGATFTFDNQKIKYVWLSIPATSEIKISYKVSVSPEVKGNQNIDGAFSYIENDETKKFILPISIVNIGGAAPVETPTLAVTPPQPKDTTPVAVKTVETVAKEVPKEIAKEVVKEEPKEIAKETPKEVEKETPKEDTATKSLSATTIPSPQGNVTYRVQIAALKKSKPAEEVATIYKLTETVSTEMEEGYTKYTVGSHNEYKSAHDAREAIKSKGVPGPWVTSYHDGRRITVQEALMITNQKWYR